MLEKQHLVRVPTSAAAGGVLGGLAFSALAEDILWPAVASSARRHLEARLTQALRGKPKRGVPLVPKPQG